jgi:hypothetical protein
MAEKLTDAADTGHFANLENIDGEYFVVEDEGSGPQDDGPAAPPPTKQTATDVAKERLRAAREQKTAPPPPPTQEAQTADLLYQPGSIDAEKRVTHAELSARLRNAATVDALDEVADLIRQIPDEDARADLRVIYKSRREELLAG